MGVRRVFSALGQGALALCLFSSSGVVSWAEPVASPHATVRNLAQSQPPPTEETGEPEEPDEQAAEEPIQTDRPDQGTSATTVPAGRVQLETGVSLTREDGQDYTTIPTSIRIGVAEHWEVRLDTDLLHLQNPGLDGFADIALGTKVTLHDGDSTKLGLLFDVNIPVGPEELRGSVDPGLKFLWDQDLGGDWSVGINVGATLTEDDNDERYGQVNWAASFSHPLGESLDFYLEAFGEGPDEAGGHHFVGADTGLLYRLNDDLQIDAYYLRGLSSFGIDWQVGSGVSARF